MSGVGELREVWALDRILADLLRWQFGALLIQRAGWQAADPDRVTLAVQDYRRRILGACLRYSGLDPGALVGVRGPAATWETPLVEEFMGQLGQIAPLGEAEIKLRRFAHGQYFKYSRRVYHLMQLPPPHLPSAYGAGPMPQ
jgi:hypothetical protein